MIELCDHVIDTPDEIKIIVFNSGTLIGLNDFIRRGGHICPMSMFGLIPAWKYDQKNLMKNKISDIINRTIPILILLITNVKCSPFLFDSLIVSFHHLRLVIERDVIIKIIMNLLVFVLRFADIWNVKFIKQIDTTSGHGLGVTKWKLLNLFIIYKVSLWYKVVKVTNTYACTIVTIVSKEISVIIGAVER